MIPFDFELDDFDFSWLLEFGILNAVLVLEFVTLLLGARTSSSALARIGAQLGSRVNNATPPTAIVDEINKRLFMVSFEDDIDYT